MTSPHEKKTSLRRPPLAAAAVALVLALAALAAVVSSTGSGGDDASAVAFDRELPDFQRVSEQLEGKVRVLGVNPQSNDTDQAQAAMIERNGVTYATLRDPRDELLRQFNTTGGLPTTVFVGADGVVRKVHNGLLTEQLLLDEIRTSFGVGA